MAEAFNDRLIDRYNDERYVEKTNVSFDTVKQISLAKLMGL